MKLEFEDDLGHNPLGLAHLTTDQSALTVGYVLGGLILGSFTGAVVPVCAIAFGYFLNDVKYASRVTSPTPLPPGDHPRPDNTAQGRASKITLLGELGDWGDAPIDVTAIESLDDLLALDLDDVTINPPPSPSPSPSRTIPVQPPTPCGVSATVEGVELLNWEALRSGDRFPHLALYGSSGDGKSTLANLLLRFLGQPAIVCNPHHEPGDFQGFPVVGAGRDYAGCVEFLTWLHAEMDRRYKLRADGKASEYGPMNVLLDEYRAIAASIDDKSGKAEFRKVMGNLLSEARKVQIRLIILTQSDRVKSWGFEDMGDILECCSWFHLGSMRASAKPSHQLQAWLNLDPYRAILATGTGAMGADVSLLMPYATAQAIPLNPPYQPNLADSNQPDTVAEEKAVTRDEGGEVTGSNYPEFSDYPMHQLVMKYIANNGPKDVGAVRTRLRNDRGEARADSVTASKVISYLVNAGYLVKSGDLLSLP